MKMRKRFTVESPPTFRVVELLVRGVERFPNACSNVLCARCLFASSCYSRSLALALLWPPCLRPTLRYSPSLHLVMGCIFTSSQALRAWQRVRSQASFPADLVCLYSRPCYVVGQATARLARTIGFVDVRGEHSGSARVLGDLLVDQCTVDRSLVDEVSSPGYIFICAEGRRDDLPQIVTEAGIKLYECVGYRTRSLSVDCKELADLVPCTVVFYSPSGVKAFPVCSECDHDRLGAVVGGRACCAPKLSEPVLSSGDSECALCLLASDGVQIVAIGPTTAAALKDANLLVAATCSQPTPTALLDALRSLQPE